MNSLDRMYPSKKQQGELHVRTSLVLFIVSDRFFFFHDILFFSKLRIFSAKWSHL